ncbi:hypothetical protein [Andreprevotia chitinilytica]|uniref:hypothetical protein n=1 Tax=Andreprevotia chitinilytica TaxID=396808 RepID=UPI00068F1C28|nr:hypothetical protein [Andreprevotia chitinilytica]
MTSKQDKPAVYWGFISGAFYGSWAFIANFDHGLIAAIRAGAMQFTLSFCASSILVFVMDIILSKGKSVLHQCVAALLPINLLALVFIAGHWLAGTPHILATIAPSYLVGTVFCTLLVRRKTLRLNAAT